MPYNIVEVECTTLNDIIVDHNNSILIKLDCEGNELNILESSSSILNRENIDFIVEIMINDKDKNEVFNLMKSYGYKSYLITNAGLVFEERPLTLPNPTRKDRTLWRNHFFTKKDITEIKNFSEKFYGYWI